jgi:hypothetical protein
LINAQNNNESGTPLQLNPSQILNMELLNEDLEPWANFWRKKLFKSNQIPFENYSKAVRWIRKYDITRLNVEECKRNIIVVDDNGVDDSVMVKIGSPIDRLIYASQKLTKKIEIGLDWISLVFYVLIDSRPYIPPVDVSVVGYYVLMPSGREILNKEARLVIRKNFSVNDLNWAYKTIRKSMGIRKKKVINFKHVQLYRLVQKKGGPPKKKGIVNFWEEVKNEWNRLYPNRTYKTWKGLRIAYERLYKKSYSMNKEA